VEACKVSSCSKIIGVARDDGKLERGEILYFNELFMLNLLSSQNCFMFGIIRWTLYKYFKKHDSSKNFQFILNLS
jgi:hypothetical protein